MPMILAGLCRGARGVEVQVPEFVAQVLENARMMEDDARSYVDRMAN